MSTDKLIAQIQHEIALNGGNRHKYPMSMGLQGNEWSVVIEINSSKHTLDIETTSPNLPAALLDALTALRRAFSKPGRK